MNYITKRNGELVEFDKNRIINAIFLAASSVQGKDFELAKDLANLVCLKIEEKFQDKTISVEDIQDIVENVLIEKNHKKTAKALYSLSL